MTGSLLVLIITPVVALLALGCWLVMIFWAEAHPEWKAHAADQGPELTAAGSIAGPGELEGGAAAPSPGRQAAAPSPGRQAA